jgi:parallel beta-helix repeat protein
MRRRFSRFLALAVVVLTVPPALAAEGRTPVFAPGPIAAPGKYILTRDIAGFGLVPAIDIVVGDVDLDLNGFTVSNAFGPAPAISVSVPFVSQVTIRNGTVAAAAGGIDVPGPGEKIVIEDVNVQTSSTFGIHVLDTLNIVIRRAVIHAPGTTGILIDGAALHAATIENNVVRDAGAAGISFTAGSAAILSNRVAGSGGPGISLSGASGSLVSENTIVGSGGFAGLFVRTSKGNKLFDNVVRESASHGIFLAVDAVDNLVLNNVATGNGTSGAGHGLFVDGDQNFVDRNTLNSNAGGGLLFSATGCGNTFGRNMARGNGGAGLPACAGAPALFPPNSCNACAAPANSTFGDNLIPGPPVF